MSAFVDVPFRGAEGYLDTATIGLPPEAATNRMREVVDRWERGDWSPKDFVDPAETARAAFAELIGCTTDGVTQGSSVSALIALIASALRDNAKVLVVEGEYSSLTYPFLAHGHRGVAVDEVAPDELAERAAAYDVVAVSAVQSSDGRAADLEAIRAATHGSDTLVVVDVTQAAGWAQLDLDWADAVVGAAYKWLLGWRGQAWMWTCERLRPRLHPLFANWSAGLDPWASNYGVDMHLAPDGRGLDSSPAWFAQVAAAAVLPWLASLDRRQVEQHCNGLAAAVREAAELPPSPSPIVTIPNASLAPRLREAGFRFAARRTGVRLSFHLYNTRTDAERVVELISSARR